MPPKEINIPPELTQAIKTDKLIIFVGAGLSYSLKNTHGEPLKGWLNLVEKILDNLESQGFDVAYLKGLIGKCEPIKILDLIENDKSLPKSIIADFVKDFIHLSKENDFSLHKKIYQLSNKIITTNYDRAFENAVEKLERYTAYKGKNYELTKHKEPHASLLFKLHGCYYHADSMVLFPSQYKDLYDNPNKDAEHALLVLKNIIVNKSVLFIGCGMGDFQINNFFKKIKELQGDYNQKHFIIDTKSLDSSLDFLLRILIGDYSEIPLVIERLLEEKEKFEQQKTPEVQVLERQVTEFKEKSAKIEEELKYITDDAERMKKLLDREALKYFQKGLKFHINEEWEKAIAEYKQAVELNPSSYAAFSNWGNILGFLAKTKSGIEAGLLLQEAIKKYEKAVGIKPDLHEAYSNWGIYLRDLAKTKLGSETINELYQQAFEKFQKSIEIKPNKHEAFYNWGNVLGDLAEIKSGEDAKALHEQACEKYERAVDIKPDLYEAFTNWGNALRDLAKTKSGEEVKALYQEAFEKYQRAIQIKPDLYEAFYNWGNALGDLANIKSGEDAETLYQHAFEKYKRAIQVKPDFPEAFYGWGNVLGDLAKTKSGEDAEIIYSQVIEKYQKAIDINPNYFQAYYNMGNVLGVLAKTKSDKDAEAILQQAFEKYQRAIQIKPDFPEAFTNSGNILGNLAKTKSGVEAEVIYNQAFEKYQRAIQIKPDKHEAFNNWGANLGSLAETKSDKDAEVLYHQAFQKYKKAIEIKVDYEQAFTNWGNNLILLARMKSSEEAKGLWKQALEKSQKAVDLGGKKYNLACAYALLSDKENALLYLEQSLENKDITTDFVLQDEDWKPYLNDKDFQKLIKKYEPK